MWWCSTLTGHLGNVWECLGVYNCWRYYLRLIRGWECWIFCSVKDTPLWQRLVSFKYLYSYLHTGERFTHVCPRRKFNSILKINIRNTLLLCKFLGMKMLCKFRRDCTLFFRTLPKVDYHFAIMKPMTYQFMDFKSPIQHPHSCCSFQNNS